MTAPQYQIHQLANKIKRHEFGNQSVVLLNDANTKVMLWAFATGHGLTELVAPFPAFLQIITGKARLTVSNESVAGMPGTWIQMAAKTPRSIKALSPVVMLLTLFKIPT